MTSTGPRKRTERGAARQPIWDLPVRLFHWGLAALIAFSWWSAEEEHLEWHIWSGLAILTLLVFRLLWGFVGSSTARWRTLFHRPGRILGYVRNSAAWKAIGHSPLGALSVLAMLVVLKLQVATGLLNADDDGLVEGSLAHAVSLETSDFAHDFHDTLFDALLVLIGLHVAAIIFYRLAGKDLVRPMVSGKGEIPDGAEPMRPGKWWAALLCLIAAIAFTRWIFAGAPPFGGLI
jgi:cytochrome b